MQLVTPARTGHLCFVRSVPRRGSPIKGVVERQEINSATKHAKKGSWGLGMLTPWGGEADKYWQRGLVDRYGW